MNKKSKYLMTITILSLIFCNKVYALCSESELNHFKEIESQYKVTYDYDTNNNQNTSNNTAYEPNKDITAPSTDSGNLTKGNGGK